SQDDCTSDGACAVAFGLGSTCGDGFCSAPATCARNVDCRDAVGGAVVCEDARCRAATVDPRCSISEREGLLAELSGEGATGPRLIIGARFEQGTGNQVARTAAARLAVREMNAAGGVRGQPISLVVCDPG